MKKTVARSAEDEALTTARDAILALEFARLHLPHAEGTHDVQEILFRIETYFEKLLAGEDATAERTTLRQAALAIEVRKRGRQTTPQNAAFVPLRDLTRALRAEGKPVAAIVDGVLDSLVHLLPNVSATRVARVDRSALIRQIERKDDDAIVRACMRAAGLDNVDNVTDAETTRRRRAHAKRRRSDK